jgi:hypothetical protein
VAVAAGQDERNVRETSSDLVTKRYAINSGHHHIAKNDVEATRRTGSRSPLLAAHYNEMPKSPLWCRRPTRPSPTPAPKSTGDWREGTRAMFEKSAQFYDDIHSES